MSHEKPIVVPPPWSLRGDAFVFLDRVLDSRHDDNRIGARAFVHYTISPVGNYNEMATAVPTRRGVRVLEMPVTLESSMIGGRANWGFPKTFEEIEWTRDANRVLVRCRGRTTRARLSRFGFPLKARGWTAQTLDGSDVRVPLEIRGRARFAWIGRCLGVFLEDFSLTVWAPERL